MPEPLAVVVLALALGVLGLLLPFATHRTVLLCLSRRSEPHRARHWTGPLPTVTVQLPVYNERTVVERLVDAVCALDYPPDRLHVQLLDDSTDDTSSIAAERVRHWRARGVDIQHIRRSDRRGYKAGALAAGTAAARGELLLVLDADFVPPPRLIRDLLPPFADPTVGLVQARWTHLNEAQSALTRAQALLLDGHFAFEQGGRYRSGRFFNFNGTAGLWRRSCVEDAGGWSADTLTEDLDLSYRAQMRGWRFVYLDGVGVPAELPLTVAALEVQQKRWAQGGIETARKILPELLAGPWKPSLKIEAVVHLCGHLAHPLTLALALLLFPSAVARRSLGLDPYLHLDLLALGLATAPFLSFYGAAGRRRGKRWRELPARVIGVLSLGIGLSVPVSSAVARGLRGCADGFARTPKRGDGRRSGYAEGDPARTNLVQAGLAGLMATYLLAAAAGGYWASIPFIALFASGYARLAWPGPLVQPSTPAQSGASTRAPRPGPVPIPAGANARFGGR